MWKLPKKYSCFPLSIQDGSIWLLKDDELEGFLGWCLVATDHRSGSRYIPRLALRYRDCVFEVTFLGLEHYDAPPERASSPEEIHASIKERYAGMPIEILLDPDGWWEMLDQYSQASALQLDDVYI